MYCYGTDKGGMGRGTDSRDTRSADRVNGSHSTDNRDLRGRIFGLRAQLIAMRVLIIRMRVRINGLRVRKIELRVLMIGN